MGVSRGAEFNHVSGLYGGSRRISRYFHSILRLANHTLCTDTASEPIYWFADALATPDRVYTRHYHADHRDPNTPIVIDNGINHNCVVSFMS